MAGHEGSELQRAIWRGSLPLEIRLNPADSRSFDQTDPYIIHYPRLSYLPFLFSRLYEFYLSDLITPEVALNNVWISFEGVPLRWYHPVGLLYDLFSGAESGSQRDDPGSTTEQHIAPWKLLVHFSNYPYDQLAQIDAASKAVHDAFINTVKEADFLRSGTAKGIMSLSKDDSIALYQAVIDHDLAAFNRVNNRLLPNEGSNQLKGVPVRFYLPASPQQAEEQQPGHLRIMQIPVTPLQPGTNRQQTLGQALHTAMPSLFPSSKTLIIARPVLHGAVIPMTTVLEELLRNCAYSDGWLHISIEMIG